ncbi:MAG: TIGR03915 family putative DNA repair protein [Acetatifactor sp.]|nr:TIGR03915 family putative DNA repair protein [Acetatifactor sp.]
MIVYQCEDSMESIFTAIYRAYEEKSRPEDTKVSLTDELLLFAESVPVETDMEKAQKVARTLRKTFGEDDYFRICMALASSDPEKGQAVYRTIALGLRNRCRAGHLFDDLADEHIQHAFSLARGASREYDHLRGFLRFQEMDEDRILYAKIGPKNNIMEFLMSHFADRFPGENFMIYDENRDLVGIHPTERQRRKREDVPWMEGVVQAPWQDEVTWYLLQCEGDLEQFSELKLSDRELAYQELFTYFCHKIAIRERRNLELQRNMLPLRFREYMTEFQREVSRMKC